MLHRKHLADRLTLGRDCRLITVTGPAACGKTSLLCQWIKGENVPVAWYSLDEADNDLDTFFQYLLTALSTACDISMSPLRFLAEGRNREALRDIVSHLIGEMAEIKKDLFLVLDDYHLITCPEIHDTLSLIITHMPSTLHMIVLSRREIPFSPSRLKIRNELLDISSDDMKWSSRETDRFFREVLGIGLTPGQSEELTRHMEGWVGGLQLFALSLKGKRTMTGLTALLGKASKEAADYLLTEVVNAQPEETRTFLLKTALLDRFNSEVCKVVTGMKDAPVILDRVLQNNLFLSPLDEEATWFRYHYLLSKALRRQAHLESEEMCRHVLRTAASWYGANGYLEDAFRHAFASGDIDYAADLLEDYLGVLYDRDEIAAFRRWLLKVPPEVFIRHPLLRLLDCRFRIETVQLSNIAATLANIEDRHGETMLRYEGPKRQLCDALLLLFKYILPHWYDPENVDVDKLKEALNRVSLQNRTLSGIGMLIPFRHFYRGEMKEARESLTSTAKIIFTSGRRLDRAIWFRVVAMVERFQGLLTQSEATLNEALPYVRSNGVESGGSLEFMINLPLAWILYLRNEIDAAMARATAALKAVEQTRFLYELVDGNYLMALIHLARNEKDKAGQRVQRMRWAANAAGTPELLGLTDAYSTQAALRGDDLPSVTKWVLWNPFSRDESFSFRFAVKGLIQCEAVLRAGHYQDALSMVNILRDRCTEHHMMEGALEAEFLAAIIAHNLMDNQTMTAAIKRALAWAESERYVRPFIDRADILMPVLRDYAACTVKAERSGYLSTIMGACRVAIGEASSSRQPKEAGVELTTREKEILGFMARGLRDKEIADASFISLPTVKTHVRHILEKLDARTRVQAIERARQQKKLPA
jgi:LuxR family transcriptional regulator, maltose regulon positive regulatory protein